MIPSILAACSWGLVVLVMATFVVVVVMATIVMVLLLFPRACSYFTFVCTGRYRSFAEKGWACSNFAKIASAFRYLASEHTLLSVATLVTVWRCEVIAGFLVFSLLNPFTWIGAVCEMALACEKENERSCEVNNRLRQFGEQQPSELANVWAIGSCKEVEERLQLVAYNCGGKEIQFQAKKEMTLRELIQTVRQQIRIKTTEDRGLRSGDKVCFIEGWQTSDKYCKFGWIHELPVWQDGAKTVTVGHIAPLDLAQWYSAFGKSNIELGLAPCETLCYTTVPCKCVVLHDAEPRGNIKLILPSGKVLGESHTDHTMSLIQLLDEFSE